MPSQIKERVNSAQFCALARLNPTSNSFQGHNVDYPTGILSNDCEHTSCMHLTPIDPHAATPLVLPPPRRQVSCAFNSQSVQSVLLQQHEHSPQLVLAQQQRSLHTSRRSSRVGLGLRRLALVGHPELKLVCITPWTCSVASASLRCCV